MASFVKLKVGNRVYDKSQSLSGRIITINHSTNVAEVKADGEGETVLSRLSDLVIVGEDVGDATNANKYYHHVKEFHQAFEHPISDKPTSLSLDRVVARSTWCAEELIELIQASSDDEHEFLKAYNKFLYGLELAKEKSLKEKYTVDGIERIVAQADASTDAIYFISGNFVEAGVEPDRLFDAVQNSNMSKLFDGVAKYRESDGKILKSPAFFAPEPYLEAEIKRQLNK